MNKVKKNEQILQLQECAINNVYDVGDICEMLELTVTDIVEVWPERLWKHRRKFMDFFDSGVYDDDAY